MNSKTKLALVVVLVALFGGLGIFMFDNPFAEAQELNEIQKNIEIPEIQDQGVSEFRSDGVEIVHYQDGSKLYRASIHDGITTADDLR